MIDKILFLIVIHYYNDSINLGLNQLRVVIMLPIYTLAYTTDMEGEQTPNFWVGYSQDLVLTEPQGETVKWVPNFEFWRSEMQSPETKI